MVLPILLAGLVTLGVFLVFASFAVNANTPSRVETLATQYVKPSSLEELQFSQPFSRRVIWPALRDLARLMARYTPQQIMETSQRKLELAGNPGDLPAVEFVGLRGITAVLMALIFALLFTLMHANFPVLILLMVSGAGLGFYLPLLWINMKIRQRQEDIRYALPDALDLLTICVEAGLGFEAAMSKVSEKWQNQLSLALLRAIREIQLGKARRDAMRDMADRIGIPEMTSFVAAIIQSEILGVSLSKVLRIQSDQMRVRRRQRAEEQAHQAPVKMILPLAFLIFPSIFIILLTPAGIQISKSFGGAGLGGP